MYGDPQELHALARTVRAMAQDGRHSAHVVASAGGVQWSSTLADTLRADLAHHAASVRAVAEHLDDLAGALDAHGDEVAHRLEQIRAAERFLAGVADSARHRLASALHAVASAGEGAAQATVDAAQQAAGAARSTLAELGRAPAAGAADLVDFARRHGFGGGW